MKSKNSLQWYWWAGPLLIISVIAVIATLYTATELPVWQLIYRVTLCLVLFGIGLRFLDEAEKVRAGEQEEGRQAKQAAEQAKLAFDERWSPIFTLRDSMRSPMDDATWHEALQQLEELWLPISFWASLVLPICRSRWHIEVRGVKGWQWLLLMIFLDCGIVCILSSQCSIGAAAW